MDKTIRKVQLTQTAMEKLRSDIECDDAEYISEIIVATLARLALRRIKAWEEVMRIADVDESKETVRLSMMSNEILVYPKTGGIGHE